MEMKRMWINQPSSLQPEHKRHGENVLAYVYPNRAIARVYPLSGEIISEDMLLLILSEGWITKNKP